MDNTLVTVGIPFFNAEEYLEVAIKSILAQSYTNWKLILLDDGSSDNSLKVANGFTDSRIKVISDGKNQGLIYRLNQLIDMCETKYFARMDSDDIMHPNKIEKQIQVLEKNCEIDVLGTNAYSIDENNLIHGIRFRYSEGIELKKVTGFIHPTIIARTEWFKKHAYDIKAIRVEDVELWYRTLNSSNFQILTEPLFFYREFGNDYYKKYFKGLGSTLYVLKKHNYNTRLLKFTIKYFISGLTYFLFNLIEKENILVQRRNALNLGGITIEDVLKKNDKN